MKRLLTTILSIGALLISSWLASQNHAAGVSAEVSTKPEALKNLRISPISVTVENLPDKEKKAPSLGQVYFRLGTFDRDLSKYQLVRLPGQCVIGEIECPQPEEIQTPFDPKNIDRLDWSPDGKKAIAFESFTQDVEWGMRQIPPSSIYIFDAEEENWTKIFESSQYVLGSGHSTKWSLDGKWIAFTLHNIIPGNGEEVIDELYIIHPDGSGLKKLFSPATPLFSWSGENLLLHAPDHPYDSTSEDLYTYYQDMVIYSINPETSDVTVLFKPDRFAFLYPSPSGNFLAYADQQSAHNPTPMKEIRLFDPSGNLIQPLGSYSNQYTGIYPVSWSLDSKLIAFGNFGRMYISQLESQPIEVYQADDSHVQPGIYNAVFSPDSFHLLMEVYDGRPKLVVVSVDGKKQHEVTWSGQQETDVKGLILEPNSPSWRPTEGSRSSKIL